MRRDTSIYQIKIYMKKQNCWILAAALFYGAVVYTSCENARADTSAQ